MNSIKATTLGVRNHTMEEMEQYYIKLFKDNFMITSVDRVLNF